MTAVTFLSPVTLPGRLVTLEPLSHDHHDQLVEAVRDGELWRLWYTRVPEPAAMRTEIDRRLERQMAGTMLPFVARRHSDGRVVGMTTYVDPDPGARRLEIGYTWTAASAHGTGLNAESKLLLLTHAFEQLSCVAVEFRTHWHNRQSRVAIERLGAKQDGVLRSHVRMPDGSLRDTVVYSIVEAEWPAVRIGLLHRLASRG